MYLEIYNNYINKNEEIENKVKKIIEADENIKTKKITNNLDIIEKQKKDMKIQTIFKELKNKLK